MTTYIDNTGRYYWLNLENKYFNVENHIPQEYEQHVDNIFKKY